MTTWWSSTCAWASEFFHPIGGRGIVAGVDRVAALERPGQALGQHLSVFHAPLVEGVDAPDQALHEYLVLIQREQRTQRVRGKPLKNDQIGRAPATMQAVAPAIQRVPATCRR